MTATVPTLGRLSALASAVAGRPLRVEWAPDDRPASTDGRRILLSRSRPELARTTVVIQALLVGAGSLDPAAVRRLRGSRRVQSRYLRLEVARALIALSDSLPRYGWERPNIATYTSSAQESVAYARGRQPLDSPPPEWGAIRRRTVLSAARTGTNSTSTAALEEQRSDDQSSPDEGGTQVGRRRRRLRKARRQRSAPGQGVPADLHRQREVRSGRGGADVRIVDGIAGPLQLASGAGSAGERYPEWDCYTQRLRPQWCTVVEVAVDGPSAAASPEPSLGPALAAVRLDHVRAKGLMDGDSLDVDAAIRARIDALSGHTPDEWIYSAQLSRRTPLGVFVLIDMSGSLTRTRRGARPASELHRSSTAMLLDGMQRNGDRTAAAAFRTYGRSRVEISLIKDFDGRFDTAVREDLHRLRPSGFTRLGAAIRYAGDRLADAGTRRRLLVVITDGFPFDHGYEGDYAAHDTSHALDEVFARGIGSVCLAVGDLSHSGRMADVFGSSGFLHLRELTELQTRFPRVMHDALVHAESASRRTPAVQ